MKTEAVADTMPKNASTVVSKKDRHNRGNVANQPINPVHAHRWKVILSECYSIMEKTFGRDVKSRQGKTDTVEAMWLTSQ
ncbi:hypothetical protein T03_17516 [Trichinella britovi]|uniref:Uncharacterized protein n=1 Tax=Trichinella britovi TaxID=45882 RepID=A0A0V1CTZ4_TRIBR|nr:hypothetical protein T03_17516 [Trichinella britovi]